MLTTSCIGQSPEDRRREAQGSAPDGDVLHRPGQPCLVCHSDKYDPGGEAFVIAGTIYQHPDDPNDQGLAGAQVSLIDSEDREFSAYTNAAGNFMIKVDPNLTEPVATTDGRLKVPFEPKFPLTVAVIYQGVDKSMDSMIWREGSCASCHHGSTPARDYVEKVWHEE